jgi:hypothetical protein
METNQVKRTKNQEMGCFPDFGIVKNLFNGWYSGDDKFKTRKKIWLNNFFRSRVCPYKVKLFSV